LLRTADLLLQSCAYVGADAVRFLLLRALLYVGGPSVLAYLKGEGVFNQYRSTCHSLYGTFDTLSVHWMQSTARPPRPNHPELVVTSMEAPLALPQEFAVRCGHSEPSIAAVRLLALCGEFDLLRHMMRRHPLFENYSGGTLMVAAVRGDPSGVLLRWMNCVCGWDVTIDVARELLLADDLQTLEAVWERLRWSMEDPLLSLGWLAARTGRVAALRWVHERGHDKVMQHVNRVAADHLHRGAVRTAREAGMAWTVEEFKRRIGEAQGCSTAAGRAKFVRWLEDGGPPHDERT
jgi:hypothetical protein